jgi:hypothetical protein
MKVFGLTWPDSPGQSSTTICAGAESAAGRAGCAGLAPADPARPAASAPAASNEASDTSTEIFLERFMMPPEIQLLINSGS